MSAAALAASGRQPAPPGSFEGAPPQYTQFSTAELMRGFLALSFGSDLRIGARPRGIRRFDHPIRAAVIAGGSVDRAAAMRSVLDEYAQKVPNLRLTIVAAEPADIEVRLIDERNFTSALRMAFGAKVARTFIARTDPQCMTSVKSSANGGILCYLNVDGRIRDAVAQVGKLGGKVIEPTKSIGPHGFRAVVLDSEGNRLALHSQSDR